MDVLWFCKKCNLAEANRAAQGLRQRLLGRSQKVGQVPEIISLVSSHFTQPQAPELLPKLVPASAIRC
jgi:hypothetical protein